MKPSTLLLSLPSLTTASFSIPTSTPATEVLQTSSLPASVTGKLFTSAASAVYSVDVKYFNSDRYETVVSDLFSAAAKASDSEKVVPSLALSSLSWPDITGQPWYDKNVPGDDKKYISSYIDEWQKAYQKVVGDDDKSPAERNTVVMWAAAGFAGALAVALAL